MRHRCESILYGAGIPLIVIDRLLGHKPQGSMGRRRYQM
jgi:hypothetical protein